MDQETWTQVNNLLRMLHLFRASQLVGEYFKKYDNDAPPRLLSEQIAAVQKLLDARRTP